MTDFIVRKGFINEGYNAWKGIHCKRFAKEIFDKVAANKTYHFEEEEQALKQKGAALLASTPLLPVVTAAAAGPAAGVAAAAAMGIFLGRIVYNVMTAVSTGSTAFTHRATPTSECRIEDISTPEITVVAIDRRAASY